MVRGGYVEGKGRSEFSKIYFNQMKKNLDLKNHEAV